MPYFAIRCAFAPSREQKSFNSRMIFTPRRKGSQRIANEGNFIFGFVRCRVGQIHSSEVHLLGLFSWLLPRRLQPSSHRAARDESSRKLQPESPKRSE